MLINSTSKLQIMHYLEGMEILFSMCLHCFKYDSWLKCIFMKVFQTCKKSIVSKGGIQPQG